MGSDSENTDVEKPAREAFQVTRETCGQSFVRFLEEGVWPELPAAVLGRRPTRDEEDEILGYGPEGV